MFPQLSTSQIADWGFIYKPHGESSHWGQNPAFLLLTGRSGCPDQTCLVVPTVRAVINWSDAASIRSHATGRVRSQFRRSRTSLYSIGRCCPASGRFAFQRPVTAAAKPLDRSVRLLCYQRPVERPVTSVGSFLCDLASGLVHIFVLGLCLISWVFSYASKVLLMVLIIGSSHHLRPCHVLHPNELQNNHLQIH